MPARFNVLCHHEAVLPAGAWSDTVLVRAFRPRMVCTAPTRARVTFQMAGCVVILNDSESGGPQT